MVKGEGLEAGSESTHIAAQSPVASEKPALLKYADTTPAAAPLDAWLPEDCAAALPANQDEVRGH